MRSFYLILLVTVMLSGCSDVIDLDLAEGRSQIAIDAFLTDQDELWRVEVNRSQDYFDNSILEGVTDASVQISDDAGNVYNLTYDSSEMAYTASISDTVGVYEDGRIYTLDVAVDGIGYTAKQSLNPVPVIDSIRYTFIEEFAGLPSGYFAEFYAFDLANRKDYYWIRGYRNNSALTSTSSIVIAEDAAFGGEGADGLMFIPPVRQGITEFNRLYQEGDSLRVELLAISESTYDFIYELRSQLSNSTAGLFAVPPANVRTNITSDDPDDHPAVGWFSIGRKSIAGLTITKEGATSIQGF